MMRRAIVAMLIALGCLASGAATAAAHTALTSSTPADGATEGTAPAGSHGDVDASAAPAMSHHPCPRDE
jgi:methionine-rich copper-binding protein CopC